MKSSANKTLNLRPRLWRTRVHVLFLFAAFMTLAAWVLYLQGTNYNSLLVNGELPYAPEININADKGLDTNRNGDLPAAGIQFIPTPATRFRLQSVASRDLRMRVSPVARILWVPPPPALFNT